MKVTRILKSLAVAAALCAGAAHAQVSVMLPANPGGGWDATGRQAFQALNKAGIYTGTVNFSNRGGAGGTIGLAEFQRSQEGKADALAVFGARSEEHTSELQSRENLVCSLLLEKK